MPHERSWSAGGDLEVSASTRRCAAVQAQHGPKPHGEHAGRRGMAVMTNVLVRLTIAQSELFSTWPEESLDRLIEAADLLVAEPGTCIHQSGDPANYLYLLVNGWMNLSRAIPEERDFTAGLHLAGAFQGLGPVITQTPHMHTATCKEKTVLVRIPGALLREMVARDGRLSFSLFAALQTRHRRALTLYASAAVHSIQAKIAGLLTSINARSAGGRTSAMINLSQDEIATMLGTRRQVVNRALRDMAAEGAVDVQYGKISITDMEKLQKMSQKID
ncbi:cAMP regulatory protein [Variovorax sp. SRS16]|nr:cAMP regulatory protein [Variovorax sp. SRS16]